MTADDYLGRVAFVLRDLPWRMRRELVAELRAHLAELPADTDLAGRLGTPEQYAADLRSAAGLERRRGAVAFLRAHRPRNVILTVVVLAAIGLGIGAVVWVQTYQPLAFGGTSLDPSRARAAPGLNGESVVFHEGRPFRYGITVRNTGRFTVRVLGAPDLGGLPVSVRLLMSAPTEHGGIPPSLTPFHPFDLQPGEERGLVLQGIYDAPCRSWASGGSVTLADFPVRFRFLWRTATARVPLPEQLAIVIPRGGGGACR